MARPHLELKPEQPAPGRRAGGGAGRGGRGGRGEEAAAAAARRGSSAGPAPLPPARRGGRAGRVRRRRLKESKTRGRSPGAAEPGRPAPTAARRRSAGRLRPGGGGRRRLTFPGGRPGSGVVEGGPAHPGSAARPAGHTLRGEHVRRARRRHHMDICLGKRAARTFCVHKYICFSEAYLERALSVISDFQNVIQSTGSWRKHAHTRKGF